jgi:hypothetical protein
LGIKAIEEERPVACGKLTKGGGEQYCTEDWAFLREI